MLIFITTEEESAYNRPPQALWVRGRHLGMGNWMVNPVSSIMVRVTEGPEVKHRPTHIEHNMKVFQCHFYLLTVNMKYK